MSFRNKLCHGYADFFSGFNWTKGLSYTVTFPAPMARNRQTVVKQMSHFLQCVDRIKFDHLIESSLPHRCQRINIIENTKAGDYYHCHGLIQASSHPKSNEKYRSASAFKELLEVIWDEKMYEIHEMDNRDELIKAGKPTPERLKIALANQGEYSPERWANYISKTAHKGNSELLCWKTSWFSDGPDHTTI